jgi:hypothetical protein
MLLLVMKTSNGILSELTKKPKYSQSTQPSKEGLFHPYKPNFISTYALAPKTCISRHKSRYYM